MDDQHMPQVTDAGTPAGDANQPVRRRLGRGLSALLGGGDEGSAVGGEALERQIEASADKPDPNLISVELIDRNPFQPRKDFDDETLKELTDSIRQHGVLQPILVRPHGSEYQLIAGERRWLAAKQAGLEMIPCRVLELEDQSVFEVAIEENLKRKDLNVLEKAQAFQDYIARFGSTIDQLAKKLSLNRSTVSNFLRLLELPDNVKKALRADKITNGHARALLPLPEEQQVALCRKIQSEQLSVRKVEEMVREILQTPEETATIPFPTDGSAPPADQPAEGTTNHVLSLQEQLRDHFGVKVEIKVKGKDAGKIILHFTNNDEFERIVRQIRRAA